MSTRTTTSSTEIPWFPWIRSRMIFVVLTFPRHLQASTSSSLLIPMVFQRKSSFEHNTIHLSTTSFGVGYLRLDVNVPKSVAPFDHIFGPAVIYNTDPLLHIYLRAEKGSVDVSGIKITGVSDENALNEIRTSLDFAACDLHISNFAVSSAGSQLLASFQILDGNTPVYLKDVSVLVGDSLIRPQFSTSSMLYSFTLSGVSFPAEVRISAPLHGCGTLNFEKRIDRPGGSVSYGVIALLIAIIVFGVAFYL